MALGTASGRGAIAVVRVSGEAAVEVAGQHLKPWPIGVREPRLCTVHDSDRILDHAVVTLYAGPQSFTGEDIVEISTHGGYVVPASVMAALIRSGAREALPGEFTRRAVLNGKLDIVQAEAIGDLVDAQSSAMQQVALHQIDGGLSARIASVRQGVLSLESLIAYDIDFPEEDDGPVSRERILQSADSLLELLDRLLSTIPVGEIVRDGAVVVIAGEPNVGKSSLFNALLGEGRAIVTEIPGTTRDAIEGRLNAGEWPLRLVDTAGLRESTDIVERLGIEVSERYLGHAHLILACGDSEESLERTRSAVSAMSPQPILGVFTKMDTDPDGTAGSSGLTLAGDVRVSAVTGKGLGLLRSKIEATLTRFHGEITPEIPVLMHARHILALQTASEEIQEFKKAWATDVLPAPVAAVHLRVAVSALEGLIGAVSTDDVLERVFSSFCVGK